MFLCYLKILLFVDPGAEPAGHKDSRSPVSASVCQHCGGAHLYPGQSPNSAHAKPAATYPDLEMNLCPA